MIALITQTVVVRVDDEAEAEAVAEKLRNATEMGSDLHLSFLEHEYPDADVAGLVAAKISVIGPTVQLIPEELVT